jgi:hypothetical protein
MLYGPLPLTVIIRKTVLTVINEIKDAGICTKFFAICILFEPKPGTIHKDSSQVIRINT